MRIEAAQAYRYRADLRGMRHGAAFRRILDEKLADSGCQWTSPAEPARPFGLNAAGPNPAFLFGRMAGPGAATFAAAFAYTGSTAGWPTIPPVRPVAPRRPARQLTPAQQRALECLRSLGACGLDADSSDSEVRSAFRQLARRYHPDRHPGADESRRASLARDFAKIAQAYHQFTAVTTH